MPPMRTLGRHAFLAILLSLFWGCAESTSNDGEGPDSGAPDASTEPDAGFTPPATRGTTYYVVRHAERDPGDDPPLNAEGTGRAERLADALESAGVDEIITTTFVRGQETGQPLSARTGAPIVVAPFEPTAWPQLATQVAQWQVDREVTGGTYLMIGHSGGYNTTLLGELGATVPGPLAERYQDLVMLIREQDGTARISLLQYGGTSSLDP